MERSRDEPRHVADGTPERWSGVQGGGPGVSAHPSGAAVPQEAWRNGYRQSHRCRSGQSFLLLKSR
jgi:hypothetical protein